VTEVTPAQDIASLFELAKQFWLTGAISTAISTFIGAYFAFLFSWIAERRKKNTEESILLNKATAIILSHINILANFRKRCSLPKLKELNEMTEANDDYRTRVLGGETADQLIMLPQHLFLKTQLIEYLKGSAASNIASLSSISGRPLMMALELERSTEVLNALIKSQNQIIDERLNSSERGKDLYRLLGLVMEDGTVDNRFRDYIEQMDSIALDAIFFADFILNDITSHHLEWRRVNGGPNRSVMNYEANDDFKADFLCGKDLQEWGKIPIVRRYKI
jgi:hypothetical protein